MDPTYPDVDRTYWVTIVNLTPYNFKLEVREKPYQIDPYDFGDIPPGKSRPNMVHYGGGNPVDSNGHFYYVLEGTNEHKEFVVKATTHIPDDYPMRTVFDLGGMGLGSREYSNPWMHGGVTLVITGSEEYGFVTSLNHGPGNWMHRIKDVIKDRDVRHVIFPGTHDSGMSYISGKILSGGSSVNTQTQNLNMYDQLRCGARWFDLRIASIHQTTPNEGSYEFWAAHVSDELAEVVLGNTGESLDDIISEINHFTAENPGELIFLRMKYLVGFRKVPSLGPIRWGSDINSGILGDFISHLRGLHNRCTNWDTSKQFHEQPIGNFLGGNGGGGCVIVILDGQIEKSIESVNDGIYSVSHIRFWDDWSQQGFTDSMASKEISDWKTVNRPGGGGRSNDDQIFINQWLPSAAPLDIQGFGLQAIAVIPTNPTLYWAGVNNISPETFPNVLMVDYIGEVTMNDNAFDHLSAEMYAVSIGLNLFTLSENCNINPKRPPLYPPVTKNAKALFSISSTETEPAKLAFEPWTGVIFANGTVRDETPAGFSWDGPLVTKDGVTFHNVSALTTASETPNPLARQNGTLSSNTTQPLRFRRASLQ
ncbi:exo-beta-1,3-glucanase [Thozetella sp. PMI_491]|nr:exo-beta-1,3-glucanase [Thozetella sp. PMI_491]